MTSELYAYQRDDDSFRRLYIYIYFFFKPFTRLEPATKSLETLLSQTRRYVLRNFM